MAHGTRKHIDGSEAVNVRLSGEMLARIDEFIRRRGLLHRSEAIRTMVAAGLQQQHDEREAN